MQNREARFERNNEDGAILIAAHVSVILISLCSPGAR